MTAAVVIVHRARSHTRARRQRISHTLKRRIQKVDQRWFTSVRNIEPKSIHCMNSYWKLDQSAVARTNTHPGQLLMTDPSNLVQRFVLMSTKNDPRFGSSFSYNNSMWSLAMYW